MNSTFWVIERNDIPWGSKPAGTTLYYSLGPGTSWFEDIAKALQFSRQEDAQAYWHKGLHRDIAFRVVEHAWITPGTEPPQSINSELLEAAKEAKEALETCYNVNEYPANGKTSQDRAIALLDTAISNAEKASSIAKAEREMGEG